MHYTKLLQSIRQDFLVSLFLIFVLPRIVLAFCHEIELVRSRTLRHLPIASRSDTVTIQWLGHAAFLLTSSKGTKVLMDPHGRSFSPPAIFPDVVTTSHLHGNHSFIWMAQGNPIVLHGLDIRSGEWSHIHRTIHDVSIYTVPAYHDSELGFARGKNAIFVVSMDGICIAHLGDLGHLLTEEQLKKMGKIDVLPVPLGQGGFRITSEDAVKIVAQVKPRVAIPQHYRWEGYVDEFVETFPRVRKLNGNSVQFSKKTFKHDLEVVVLKDTIPQAPRDDL